MAIRALREAAGLKRFELAASIIPAVDNCTLQNRNRTSSFLVHCGEVMIMAHLGKFPFVPNMDDCKMVVTTDGAVCYIMDTFCRNMTKEDKEEADRKIIQIYLNAEMRKLSNEQPPA